MFKGRAARLLFYVVLQGTSLLGIDAIKALDLHIEGSTLRCFETTPPQRRLFLYTLGFRRLLPASSDPPLLQDLDLPRVKVRTTVPPVASKLRRLPLSLRPQVSAELCRLESLDVIERLDLELLYRQVEPGTRQRGAMAPQLLIGRLNYFQLRLLLHLLPSSARTQLPSTRRLTPSLLLGRIQMPSAQTPIPSLRHWWFRRSRQPSSRRFLLDVFSHQERGGLQTAAAI
ncbi:hypothetical protein HPB47_027060, partial [Ixodes persulcatus]